MPSELPVDLPDFLEEAGGEIRIRGHRVTLYHVLKEYNAGESAEGIVLNLPTSKTSTIHRIITFYLDHQMALDLYFRDYTASLVVQESATCPSISRAELLGRITSENWQPTYEWGPDVGKERLSCAGDGAVE